MLGIILKSAAANTLSVAMSIFGSLLTKIIDIKKRTNRTSKISFGTKAKIPRLMPAFANLYRVFFKFKKKNIFLVINFKFSNTFENLFNNID